MDLQEEDQVVIRLEVGKIIILAIEDFSRILRERKREKKLEKLQKSR